MQFSLSYNNFAEELQLPVNPREFRLSAGNKDNIVDIQGLGEINFIGGTTLASIQIDSFFPSRWGPYCTYQNVPEPYEAVDQIENWRKEKKPIRLIITETPVNMACAIESFEYGEKGGTRDVSYSLVLKEYRFITVDKVAGLERPDTRIRKSTHTVKSGECLMTIAKEVYGDSSRWIELYQSNQSLIGPDPNLIYPGQQLVVM